MAAAAPLPARFMSDVPPWADEWDVDPDPGEATYLPEAAKAWQIESDGQAEWALRRLAELEDRTRKVAEQAAEWRFPIDQWEREELARLEPRVDFFRTHLETYGLRRRVKGDATTRLPSGRIATRGSSSPVVSVSEAQAVIDWLEDRLGPVEVDAIVKVEKAVRVAELRRAAEARPVDLPYCSACGSEISGSPEGWVHADEPLFEYDHDALPVVGYEVVLVGTDEKIPGTTANIPEPTVTVTITR